jgi:putative transposase
MTYQSDFTLPSELLEQIASQGFDILPELIRIVLNAAMQGERQQYLGAAPYQHSPDRNGHANGYKPKTVKTRLGEIRFDVPQVREGGFYPQALEKGLAQRAGAQPGAGRDVRAGGVHSQSDGYRRAIVRQ